MKDILDRDLNAARNILARGLASLGIQSLKAPRFSVERSHDCGITRTCDAVTDLAAENTELIVEMAAALLTDYDAAHRMLREEEAT